jgi:hypothetical protein
MWCGIDQPVFTIQALGELMRWPFVSRELLEREREINTWLRAQNETLFNQLIAMKRDGFAMPGKTRVVEPPAEPEVTGLRRAEGKKFVEQATRQIMNDTGAARADAEREARRLYDESIAEQPG